MQSVNSEQIYKIRKIERKDTWFYFFKRSNIPAFRFTSVLLKLSTGRIPHFITLAIIPTKMYIFVIVKGKKIVMVKKLIGVLICVAAVGGLSLNQIKGYLEQEIPSSEKISGQTGEGSPQESPEKGQMDNGASRPRKMRLEIPAFLTDRPEEVVWHKGYTVSFNRKTKLPNWVAWELTKTRTEGTYGRSDDFQPDPDIKKGSTAEDTDYRRSGYDRGHMCPAADNKYDKQAMTECFYFSNICPQLHNLNGGDWKELEEKCRKWARKYDCIYITCGPIITSTSPKTIGANKITVPDAFYKVVMRQDGKKDAKAIGFIFKHQKQNKPLEEYAVSVDEVERQTGIDFFSKMPDHIEKKMEATCNVNDWM